MALWSGVTFGMCKQGLRESRRVEVLLFGQILPAVLQAVDFLLVSRYIERAGKAVPLRTCIFAVAINVITVLYDAVFRRLNVRI